MTMKTKHSIRLRHRLVLALALSLVPAFVSGQNVPKVPDAPPKEVKVPKTPNVPKEAPKVPDAPKTIKVPNTPKVVQQPNVPKEAPKIPTVPKNVPKVVEAPKVPNVPKNIPKIVEAPKVPKTPNIPKTPNVPKTPPVVKVPDAPKIPKTPVVVKVPDAPKVPKNAPKVPAVAKVPNDAPKTPKVPKTPVVVEAPKVKVPVTSSPKGVKAPRTPVVAAKTAEVPQTPSNSNASRNSKTTAKDATVQEALDIVLGNKRKTDPGGPAPEVPGIDRSSGKQLGLPGAGKDGDSALKGSIAVMRGEGSSQDSQSSIATGKTDKPGFNQGLDEKPKTVDASVGASLGGNPIKTLTGGGIGDQLAADSKTEGGKAPRGIAGQGKGAISYSRVGATVTTEKYTGDQNVDAAKTGTTPTSETKNLKGDTTFTFKDGSTLLVRADGTQQVREVGKFGEQYTEYDKTGKGVSTTTVIEAQDDEEATPGQPAKAGGVKRPAEDASDPEAFAKFLNEHPAIAQQIIASRSGGSGDIDMGNADNSTSNGPKNGTAPPASGTTGSGLVSQPGRTGGEGSGANGRGGFNFNGNGGAIDPGDDQTVTAGNRQEDAGKALGGGKPAPLRELQAPEQDSQKPNFEPGKTNGRPEVQLLEGGTVGVVSAGSAETKTEPASSSKISNEAMVQEALDIIRGNRSETLPGGPEPDVPGIDRSNGFKGGTVTGKGSEGDIAGSIAVMRGEGASQDAQSTIDTGKTDKPGVDQGFGDKSKSIDPSVGANLGGNPINSLTGGSIGGPLGDAAQNSNGKASGGIAGQGKGAISDGASGKNIVQQIAESIASMGSGAKAGTEEDVSRNDVPADSVVTDKNHTEKDAEVIVTDSEHGQVVGYAWKDGRVVELYPTASGSSEVRVHDADGSTTIYEYVSGGKLRKVWSTNDVPNAPAGGGVKRPAEDAPDPAALAKFLRENPAIAQQIVASRSGGSGNIDFGNIDNTTANGPRNGKVPPAAGVTGKNLFGQPIRTEGEGSGANGRGGIDYNGNAGATDPTPDQTATGGNRQQDPGKVMQSKPTPEFPRKDTDNSNTESGTKIELPKSKTVPPLSK